MRNTIRIMAIVSILALASCSESSKQDREPVYSYPTQYDLLGYYSFTFTSTSENAIALNTSCVSGEGQASIFRGQLAGWAGGFELSASAAISGSVRGTYAMDSTHVGTIDGFVDGQTGSGTWTDFDNLCNGSWDAQKILFPTVPEDNNFTHFSDAFPPALKIMFRPSVSNGDLFCEIIEGFIVAKGPLGSSDTLNYSGYADSVWVKEHVQLKLDTVSGTVQGTIGVADEVAIGEFNGGLYFSDTFKPYRMYEREFYSECVGIWFVTTIDQEF